MGTGVVSTVSWLGLLLRIEEIKHESSLQCSEEIGDAVKQASISLP